MNFRPMDIPVLSMDEVFENDAATFMELSWLQQMPRVEVEPCFGFR